MKRRRGRDLKHTSHFPRSKVKLTSSCFRSWFSATRFIFHSWLIHKLWLNSIGIARAAMPPKFPAYLFVLCFVRRCPKQNTVARLQSKYLTSPKNFGLAALLLNCLVVGNQNIWLHKIVLSWFFRFLPEGKIKSHIAAQIFSNRTIQDGNNCCMDF